MTAPRDPSRFLTRQPLPRREPPVRRDTWPEQVSVDRYIATQLRQARRWAEGAVVFLCFLIVILACSVVGPAVR